MVHESSARDYVRGAQEWRKRVVHEKNFSRLGMGPPAQTLVDRAWVLQGKL